MSDDADKVRSFEQSPQNIARLQELVRKLALDSTQVNVVESIGLGQGEWEDVTDFDVTRMLRRCILQPSLERKSESEWVVRAMGFVGETNHIIATTVIVHRMWLVVTSVERTNG
jgi:hypothetical protein